MAWVKRGKEVQALPVYDIRTGHFTIDLHHGGCFEGNGGLKRIVHFYAKVDSQVDVQHSGPSTSHRVLRRSPRKQQRISQLEGERGIQIDAYDPYSSSSPDDDPFYPDSEWDGRNGDEKDYDIFVDGNE
ncbi:hypothetical protein Droror1_Dr00027498 [Drosera rotundifolia]